MGKKISFGHKGGKKDSVDIEVYNAELAEDWMKVILCIRGS